MFFSQVLTPSSSNINTCYQGTDLCLSVHLCGFIYSFQNKMVRKALALKNLCSHTSTYMKLLKLLHSSSTGAEKTSAQQLSEQSCHRW